jgi:hypothetical protein
MASGSTVPLISIVVQERNSLLGIKVEPVMQAGHAISYKFTKICQSHDDQSLNDSSLIVLA